MTHCYHSNFHNICGNTSVKVNLVLPWSGRDCMVTHSWLADYYDVIVWTFVRTRIWSTFSMLFIAYNSNKKKAWQNSLGICSGSNLILTGRYYYLRQGGYVFGSVCLSVCLSVLLFVCQLTVWRSQFCTESLQNLPDSSSVSWEQLIKFWSRSLQGQGHHEQKHDFVTSLVWSKCYMKNP